MLAYEDRTFSDYLDQLGATADFDERVVLLQEMGRHMYSQLPRIEIAEVFGLYGIGENVKTWATAPGNGFIHNTAYVNLNWAPPGQPVTPWQSRLGRTEGAEETCALVNLHPICTP